MSTMILPAVLYLIFAVSLFVSILLMNVNWSSEIYQASVERFEKTPWQFQPHMDLYQVRGPHEVYKWLTRVFVPQVYSEMPANGDHNVGYCTKNFPCVLNEGTVQYPETCADGLKMGDKNCAGFMASSGNCCEQCQNSSENGTECGTFSVRTDKAQYETHTSVTNLASNCENPMPSWYEDLNGWISETGAPVQSSQPKEFLYCPERQSKQSREFITRKLLPQRSIRINKYNKVLMARISMKRWKLVDVVSSRFKNAYGKQTYTNSLAADMSNMGFENTESFGCGDECTYQKNEGFRDSGGFVSYMYFDGLTKNRALNKLAFLEKHNWFDLHQGSFVLELLIFNGNVDKFLHVAFIFEHQFSGRTQVKIEASALELSLHSYERVETYVRLVLYVVILVLFVYFVKNEVDDMQADYVTYFSNFMALLNIASLVICAYCIVEYLTIVLSFDFINFTLPFDDDVKKREEQFKSLVDLAQRTQAFMMPLAINLLFTFARFISLLTGLFPDSGIVFNSIHQARFQLLGFLTVFVVMIVGFTFAGFYIFGVGMVEYSSLDRAFITTLKAIMRETLFSKMYNTSPALALGFFLTFHLFFLIVKQPMLSIIIYGYCLEKKRMQGLSDSDRFPMKRFWHQLKTWIRESSGLLNRCIVSLNQILFGTNDGASMRINWDRVASLQDRRATRPRQRRVQYVSKQYLNESTAAKDKDDLGAKDNDANTEPNDPSKDIHLVAKDPYYPRGMMQYYVDYVKPEGSADENKVRKDFRLVGIQKSRGSTDREQFREEGKFKSDAKGYGYEGNTQKMLQELKVYIRDSKAVELEFEGAVKPYSIECICLILYIIVFLFLSLSVGRGEQSYSVNTVHNRVLHGPSWYEYNPKRVADLDTLYSFEQLRNWAVKGVLESKYGCVTKINTASERSSKALCTEGLTNTKRSRWGLFANGWSEVDAGAGSGLSLGYTPLEDDPKFKTSPLEVELRVQVQDYNVGVMPNNQVRLSYQLPCYQKNPEKRFADDYPVRVHRIIQESWGCSKEPCMKQMIDSGTECLDEEGQARNISSILGRESGIQYKYDVDSSYQHLGAITMGFGVTQSEAQTVFSNLDDDKILDDPVSTVFESVSYNGNVDLFSYTTVQIDLLATGYVSSRIFTSTVPLNAFSIGPNLEGTQNFMRLLVFVFIVFAAIFAGNLLYDLWIQYQICNEKQRPFYMFPIDFFSDSWWNFVDVTSTVFSIMLMISWLQFETIEKEDPSLDDPSPKSWTLTKYTSQTVTIGVDKNFAEHDQFYNFYLATDYYNRFTLFCALNGLFMMFRLIKYFGAIQQLRLMMKTLGSAFYELFVMTLIIVIMFVGFAFLFYTRFALKFGDKFGSFQAAFSELFLYACGRFDVDGLFQDSPTFFFISFSIFEIFFFLLFTMYLAAIAFRWKDSRRDAQEFSLQSSLGSLMQLLQSSGGPKASSSRNAKMLDMAFWKSQSVLERLNWLDHETGKIKALDEKGHLKDKATHGEKAITAFSGDNFIEGMDPDDGDHDLKSDGGKKLLSIFKKAHMEIASQLCRAAPTNLDRGAGVGSMDEGPRDPDQMVDLDNGQPVEIGIVEEPVEESVAENIENKLAKLLQEREHPAEEIWLDALVTVLESSSTLEKIQEFFLPMPMIQPEKVSEWGNFSQKKIAMERRLDLFLKWLQEETKTKHYRFLKECATAKERVLKQQSLVLTDYLEHLDGQIEHLEKQIKDLNDKNEKMKKYVQPLL
jgi:hypothetical protein